MPYRVLIVDDQRMSRKLFESIVSANENYTVAAAVETAMFADAWCARGGIDLVLMDVVMKDGSNGLDAAARIKASYPEIKVIIVTSMPDPLFLKKARDARVDSFWYKEVDSEPMLRVMDKTMAGEPVWPDRAPEVRLGLIKNSELTEREMDVLRLLAEGRTDREIGERLELALPTVRYHVRNLISKTGYSSRTELAVDAVRSGLTIPGIG